MSDMGVAMSRTSATMGRDGLRVATGRRDASPQRIGLEILALVVIAALLIAGPLMNRAHVPTSVDTVEVRAESGDSLWSIAENHPIDGLTTAQTVEVIAAVNGLNGPLVAAGGSLNVPQGATNMVVASK